MCLDVVATSLQPEKSMDGNILATTRASEQRQSDKKSRQSLGKKRRRGGETKIIFLETSGKFLKIRLNVTRLFRKAKTRVG